MANKLTEERHGQNVIPLRDAAHGEAEREWAIDTNTAGESFLRGAAADMLAAYEATGFSPEEFAALVQDVEARALLWFEKNYDITAGRIMELAVADKEKRLLTLPVPLGTTIYTVREDHFNCGECKHAAEAKFRPHLNRISCGMEDEKMCPLYIQEHEVGGFAVGCGELCRPVLSAPGEWGCEKLETVSGRDGTWHKTRDAAEVAKTKLENREDVE